jgi:toxin HigB-1
MVWLFKTPGADPIELSWADKKLEQSVSTEHALKRRWGKDHKVLARRIAALLAADALDVLTTTGVAGRCHALTGDRKGQYALNLWGAVRLVFEPANDPIPRKPDGGIDEQLVTAVRLLGVVDYHGR